MIDKLARLLATSAVRRFICERAFKDPYKHIYDKDGSLYMARWWVLRERSWFPWAIRLHHIGRPDNDRHLHDHPYDFRSVLLAGWYEELDVFGQLHMRWAGETYARRAQESHKIVTMSSGGAYTLFIYRYRKKSNPWGFYVPNHDGSVRKVHWRTYLGDQ